MSCSKSQSGEEDAHLRMVLVGKTGAGKSAAGNTIIGENRFKSSLSAAFVTAKCQKEKVEFGAQTLAVVDTPGLFDTVRSKDKVKLEIAKCISFAAPGPHVFLVVIQAGRFTEEEQETVRLIQELFGESAEYTMALFTRGDDLEADGVSIEDIIKTNPALENFLSQCRGGYHVFNNKSKDRSQVKELLKKINSLVQRNGGKCFTNEMLQEAERAIKKKQEQLMKENPTMTAEDARKKAEENNLFIEAFLRLISMAGVGALGGAIMTAAAGEAAVGVAVKAAAGGAILMVTGAGAAVAGAPAVGAVALASVPAVVIAAAKVVNEKCVIQ